MKWLVRLYPKAWRDRYGEEFEALIEEAKPGWGTSLDLLKGAMKMQLSIPNFPRLALVFSIAGLAAGFGASFLVTPTYSSESEMTLRGPGDPRPVMMEIEQEVLSRTTLSSVILDPRLDLYRREREKSPLEDVIETMRTRDIRIGAAPARFGYPVFAIGFTYSDPHKAQMVNQILIVKLQEANTERQRSAPKAVLRDYEIETLESRIAVLEKRLGVLSPPLFDRNDRPPVNADAAIQVEVLDPPSLPVNPTKPNRPVFAAAGFGTGVFLALVTAIFRRPAAPAMPFPAQTA